MEQVSEISAKVEEVLDSLAQPVKPYIPSIARFLLIVTFLEDSLRIMSQWSDQLYYLQNYQHIPWGIAELFLIVNIGLMLGGSALVMMKKFTTIAVGMLAATVLLQSIGYGLFFDFTFFIRNLSVIGGLLMLLSESLMKKKDLFAGLPSMTEEKKTHYLQLAGRVLLVALFLSFLFAGEMSFFRVTMSLVGFGVALMVVVGFKAKYSALFLVVVLCIANVILNNWWSLHHNHPHRDFLKYDFFQTLSIMGGLLLLFSMGPGAMSLDEKKKSF
ncbi:hypothetical protein MIR68_010402 [Amoeboaphelidium protococcarum]|nr:hypothetical protein MIR68_010402 [Amoeboaphelidium protococcarum]